MRFSWRVMMDGRPNHTRRDKTAISNFSRVVRNSALKYINKTFYNYKNDNKGMYVVLLRF